MEAYAIAHETFTLKDDRIVNSGNLHHIKRYLDKIKESGHTAIGIEKVIPAGRQYKQTSKSYSPEYNKYIKERSSGSRYFKGLELLAKKRGLKVIDLESSEESKKIRRLTRDVSAMAECRADMTTITKYQPLLGKKIFDSDYMESIFDALTVARSIEMDKTAKAHQLEHVIVGAHHAIDLALAKAYNLTYVNRTETTKNTLELGQERMDKFTQHQQLIEQLKQLHD